LLGDAQGRLVLIQCAAIGASGQARWPRMRGFSMIELLIALGLIGLVLVIGMPQVGVITTNNRVRALAGSFLAGLLQARSEAIQRGSSVRFQQGALVSGEGVPSINVSGDGTGEDWLSTDVRLNAVIRAASGSEAGAAAVVTVSSADAARYQGQLQFDAFGQAAGAASGGFAALSGKVSLLFQPAAFAGDCSAPDGGYRCQQITVSPGGQIRLCDPAAAAGDTRAC
jgi:type IV fimbrial biogenesis protein FimT